MKFGINLKSILDTLKNANKSTWVIAIFLIFFAMAPYINMKIDDSLDMELIHKGRLAGIESEYGTGLYGSRYKTADYITFEDGTIVSDATLINDDDVIKTGDTYTCAKYDLHNILPSVGLPFGAQNIHEGVIYCSKEPIDHYETSPNYMMLIMAVIIFHVLSKKERKPTDEVEEKTYKILLGIGKKRR